MAKKEIESKPEVEDEGNDEDRATEERVNRIVNAAVSAHMTRLKGSLSKDFEGLLKPLAEGLTKLQATPQTVTPPPPGDKPNLDAAFEIERAKMADRVRELEDKYKAAENAREQEMQRRLRDEERATLVEALRKNGVDEGRLRPAIALLYTEEQRIARTDNGKVAMKVTGKYGDEFVPVEEGIAGWLKSEDGKMFLPARGAGGSGTTHSAQRGAKGGALTEKDKKAADKAAAIATLQAAFFGGGGNVDID